MDHFEKQEAEHLPTTVTDEDIANAIEDEHGAKYSPDGKRLLQGADIGTYEIKAGTEVICDNAFEGCKSLQTILIPRGSRGKFERLLPNYKGKLVEAGD